MHIERYVPQTLLLRYCDLVLAHGGFNPVQTVLVLAAWSGRRDDMASMPGAEHAVELLERLAADKQPRVSTALSA